MVRAFAALGISVGLIFGAAQAQASSVSITFSGTVTLFSDPSHISSYGIGSTIGGTLTIDPLANDPNPSGPHKTQFTGPAALTSDPLSHGGTATIETLNSVTNDGHFGIRFFAPTEHDPVTDTDFIPSHLTLDFNAGNATNTPLHSLAALPTDMAGIIAYLGGVLAGTPSGTLSGGPDASSLATFTFDITSLSIATNIIPTPPPATTPIPATLPLFGAALGALGLFRWRRRRAAGTV